MTEKEWVLYTAALARFGPKKQTEKLLEEMAELQVEICHMWDGRPNPDGLATEIADVSILLEQMQFIFDIEEKVQQEREKKLARLAGVLELERWSENEQGGC